MTEYRPMLMTDRQVNVRVGRARHSFLLWKCRQDPTGWRCGKCTRGLVLPKKGAKCRVCGARVFEVRDARWVAHVSATGDIHDAALCGRLCPLYKAPTIQTLGARQSQPRDRSAGSSPQKRKPKTAESAVRRAQASQPPRR